MSGSLRRIVAIVASGVFAGGLASAAPAYATFSTSHYSFKSQATCEPGDSDGWADPVSLVFYNEGKEINVTNHLRYHVPFFGDDDGASGQWFRSAGQCVLSGSNGSADGGGHDDRFHIRIQLTAESDPVLGITTVGTPHYEFWDYFCGSSGLGSHFVAGNNPYPPGGYNDARNYISDSMAAGNHTVLIDALYWGNTAHRHQCGGHPDAWLDGYADEIRIPSTSH